VLEFYGVARDHFRLAIEIDALSLDIERVTAASLEIGACAAANILPVANDRPGKDSRRAGSARRHGRAPPWHARCGDTGWGVSPRRMSW
jgi:hypothetical protein